MRLFEIFLNNVFYAMLLSLFKAIFASIMRAYFAMGASFVAHKNIA